MVRSVTTNSTLLNHSDMSPKTAAGAMYSVSFRRREDSIFSAQKRHRKYYDLGSRERVETMLRCKHGVYPWGWFCYLVSIVHRVGVAWLPSQSGCTSVRSSVGLLSHAVLVHKNQQKDRHTLASCCFGVCSPVFSQRSPPSPLRHGSELGCVSTKISRTRKMHARFPPNIKDDATGCVECSCTCHVVWQNMPKDSVDRCSTWGLNRTRVSSRFTSHKV